MKAETGIPFFLILRHLRRCNKWALALIIFLMAVAFINLIFVNSIFNGVIQTADDQIINNGTGNITVSPLEGHEYITDPERNLEAIRATEGIEAASPRLVLPSQLKSSVAEGSWQVVAVDPDEESRTLDVAKHMVAGSYLEEGDTEGIILGSNVSGGRDEETGSTSLKGIQVGESVRMINANGSRDFVVKGIFQTKFADTDEKAFIARDALAGMDPALAGRINNIVIRTTGAVGTEDATIERLRSEGVGDRISSWEASARSMKELTSSFASINTLLTLVGFFIAAVTIFIIVYVDINHRRTEIGILRAIGIKPSLIRSNYILQTVVYSLFGVLLGSAIFFGIIVPYFQVYPFEIPLGDVRLVIDYRDFFIRALSVIAVSILAGLLPAFFITRANLMDEILDR
jgi:ABC-type lipoprotein release transport system permease subunit